MRKYIGCILLFTAEFAFGQVKPIKPDRKPNIIIIYADDLGYGDLSCYGAKSIKTANIDRLASKGILFTNAHSSSATCTPSRYSIMTGQYAWRKKGTGVAPGDSPLLIDTCVMTLPRLLQQAGYKTGAIGKWHLGMGPKGGPDWNGNISPGANEIGFDYSFLIPATPDRVPCVYVENHRVVNLDPNDPLMVSYRHPVGDLPTGKDHPEFLKLKSSPGQGHDQTIINGIGRIGYMSGGRSAWWKDSTISAVMSGKAMGFIRQNENSPFFLYFASHDIHVPRVAGAGFAGKSSMGSRGDEILELDGETGKIVRLIDSLGLTRNTIILLTSDNGPVLDDGYQDDAVALAKDWAHALRRPTMVVGKAALSDPHRPAGSLRGGKYSVLEGGTRVPFICYWPGKIIHARSGALVSQVDLLATFARLTGQHVNKEKLADSYDVSGALLGKSKQGRSRLVEEGNTLALVKGDWKYIEPHDGPAIFPLVEIESGLSMQPQLYHLKTDIGEKFNVAKKYPLITRQMAAELALIKAQHHY